MIALPSSPAGTPFTLMFVFRTGRAAMCGIGIGIIIGICINFQVLGGPGGGGGGLTTLYPSHARVNHITYQ